MSRKPNLFIVGAPRTGTTALCGHLQAHEQIFVSEPKEPYFWCEDFGGIRQRVGCTTHEKYNALFQGATNERYLAEGSTFYLASDHAVARILEFNDQARFIALMRHPIELAYSFYAHLRFTLNEDVETFEEAWGLQAERASGVSIPASCFEPRMLQYRKIASIGSQLAQLQTIVPSHQLLMIFQDEMLNHPRQAYLDVLNFLDLADDGRTEIARVNSAATFRSGVAGRAVQSNIGRRLLNALKRCLPTKILKQARVAKQKALVSNVERDPLPAKFRSQLLEEFGGEIALIGRATGRNLDHWLT